MGKLLIKNIKSLVHVEAKNSLKRVGKEMGTITTIEDAFLAVENGVIIAYGKMDEWEGILDW